MSENIPWENIWTWYDWVKYMEILDYLSRMYMKQLKSRLQDILKTIKETSTICLIYPEM